MFFWQSQIWPCLHIVMNPLYLLWWSLLLIVDFDSDTSTSWRVFLTWLDVAGFFFTMERIIRSYNAVVLRGRLGLFMLLSRPKPYWASVGYSQTEWGWAQGLTSTGSVMLSWRSGRGLQWQPVKLWWTPCPRRFRQCWKIMVATQNCACVKYGPDCMKSENGDSYQSICHIFIYVF